MNVPLTSERPYRLSPDRFGPALREQQQAGRKADLARRVHGQQAAAVREWIVAMTVAVVVVTLVIAVKFALFLALHPGVLGR